MSYSKRQSKRDIAFNDLCVVWGGTKNREFALGFQATVRLIGFVSPIKSNLRFSISLTTGCHVPMINDLSPTNSNLHIVSTVTVNLLTEC